MKTIQDYISEIALEKELLKKALEEKGVTMDNVPFEDYYLIIQTFSS